MAPAFSGCNICREPAKHSTGQKTPVVFVICLARLFPFDTIARPRRPRYSCHRNVFDCSVILWNELTSAIADGVVREQPSKTKAYCMCPKMVSDLSIGDSQQALKRTGGGTREFSVLPLPCNRPGANLPPSPFPSAPPPRTASGSGARTVPAGAGGRNALRGMPP